ncbi:MAG: hypothetical protein AB7N76_23815 [Planctomycetota bacterium]
MNAEQLIAKAKTQYTLADVQNKSVEAVTVLDLEELGQLVERAVRERTAQLHDELANMAAGGGDALEAEAAAAALEAEAVALEAKAEAEQRAAQAESELRKAKDELAVAQEQLAAASGGGGASSEELEAAQARVKELEAELSGLEGEKQALADKVAELERRHADHTKDLETRLQDMEQQLEQAAEKGGGAAAADDEPLEPVTDADLKHARRLATAFLEDVFMDDEEKSNQAIAAGNPKQVFEKELGEAFRKYVKRVKPAVRAEAGVWEEALEACLKKTW